MYGILFICFERYVYFFSPLLLECICVCYPFDNFDNSVKTLREP